MAMPLLISYISYSILSFVSILFGFIYLIRPQFMPYHSQAVQQSWSEVDLSWQVLILALMRVAGGGFLATAITIILLLAIPFRTGEVWSIYAIPIIALCPSLSTLYATLLVKTRTPGTPPILLSLMSVGLIMIGFIFSLL